MNNVPVLCMMFASFHSKLALNTELGAPTSFSRGSLYDEQGFANGLRVPVN